MTKQRARVQWVSAVLLGALLGAAPAAQAGASRTTYPVVFAHGMGGFDNILGLDYWGDDYGTYVGDPCDGFLEVACNEDIDRGQRSFVGQVMPFESSEVRGLDLANDVEGFMATAGARYINIIGHSQGGIDARKAARLLYERRGYTAVKVLVSVSGPHRGSPVAKHILNQGAGVTSVVDALARIYGNTIYEPGNDGYASLKQLVYGDFSSADGITTGMRTFNERYPVDSRYAAHYASLLTAQVGLDVNPVMYLLRGLYFDIDGDGYCAGDCDNDGAGGGGDGVPAERDDDGLVGINSQQVGHRLRYTDSFWGFDNVTLDSSADYVGDINAPSSLQMTSMSSVIDQDHIDVVGIGPDTFDEPEFYAAIIQYISAQD